MTPTPASLGSGGGAFGAAGQPAGDRDNSWGSCPTAAALGCFPKPVQGGASGSGRGPKEPKASEPPAAPGPPPPAQAVPPDGPGLCQSDYSSMNRSERNQAARYLSGSPAWSDRAYRKQDSLVAPVYL